MKKKILIADDEINICSLILNLIDWDELELNVVGTAQDGIEAYSLIEQNYPDIVITDIKMPGIDGLELIKKTIDANIKTHFIVISGYKLFDYAHTAIKYGVQNYLVKPIIKSELTMVLKKICAEISNEKETKQKYLKIISDATISIEKLHKNFINDLIHNDISSTYLNSEYIEKEYHYKLTPGYFCIGIIHIDSTSNTDKNSISLFSQITDIISAELVFNCSDHECIESKNDIVFFMNYSKNKSLSIHRSINYIFSNIKETLRLTPSYKLTIGIGNLLSNIKDIRKSYLLAVMAIKSRYILGYDKVIQSSSIKNTQENFTTSASYSITKHFKRIIDGLNKEQCANEADQFFMGYLPLFTKYPYLAPEFALLIVNNFINVFFIAFNIKLSINEIQKSIHSNFYNCCTFDDLRSFISFWVHYVIDEYFKINDERDSKIISEAKQFIRNNYQNRIEISEIAQIVYLSPTYLGLLFKKQTGQTFHEYLIDVRMEKAKELLIGFKLNIKEISHLTGYRDVKYFSKLFQKHVGLKPTEYRKLNNYES
jgi:two-component system response regulator YesN